jgi:2-dehydro-3-deoxyglucarate aldolase
MKDNEVKYGSWLTKPNNAIVEVIAKTGYFDWLTIDIEHSTISINQVEDMMRVIQLSGLDAYIRLSKNDPVLIKRVLDAGADGIIVPMVNSASDVKKAVNACFYPPEGTRGAGLARVHNYEPEGFKNYIKNKEKKTKIMVQIEHIDAVDNIDDIFSNNHIYGYFIGPYDLSASIGKPGEYKSENVINALEKIKKSAIKHNVKPGYHVIEPDLNEIENKKNEGYKLIAISTDMIFLLEGIKSCLKRK